VGTEFSKKISSGLECIPFKELHADYLEFYPRAHPEHQEQFKAVQSCASEQDVKQCVGERLKVDLADPQLLSEDARGYCGSIALFFANTLANQQDSYSFTSNSGLTFFNSDSYAPKFSSQQYFAMEDVVRFYYQRLNPWLPSLGKHLRGIAGLKEKYASYDAAKPAAAFLVPAACSNAGDWERFDLTLEGVGFKVPVFFPKREQQRWWWYQDLLKAHFEVLKGFLTPAELEKILHPGDRADFGLYIGGDGKLAEAHRRCGEDDENAGGEYKDASNMAFILKGNWRMMEDRKIGDAQISPVTNSVAFALFHEFAHALEHHLLDTQARLGIDALQHWTKRAIGSDKSKFYLAPQPKHLGIGDSPYSLRNGNEFFANWVAEYFIQKIQGQIPSDPALRARIRILDDLFAPSGLNLQALSVDNIEKRYQEEKIEAHLATDGISLNLKFGPSLLGSKYQDESLQGWGFQFGAGLGYLYQRQSQGIVWGAGASYDYSSGWDYETVGSGVQNQYHLQTHDAGAYGLLGYNFGVVDLFLQPVLGYRRSSIKLQQVNDLLETRNTLDSIERDSFFGGAELGFMHHKTGLGLRLGGRYAGEGGFNAGLWLSLDPLSIFHYKDSATLF